VQISGRRARHNPPRVLALHVAISVGEIRRQHCVVGRFHATRAARRLNADRPLNNHCILHCILLDRLRIRILRILKFPKIHEYLRILKLLILKFVKFKLSHSSPPSSNKLFVSNTELNCWTINSVMSTVQDSSTRQQFIILLQTLRITAASLSSTESETSTAHCSRSTVASV